MLNSTDTLQLYLAVKLHFSSKGYDVIKYNWKVNRKLDITKRNDKHFFRKLADHRDPKNLLVANLSVNPNMWIGEILSSEGEERYRQMLGRWEGLTYRFSEDLKKLDDDFQVNVVVKEHQHPKLLKLYLQRNICLESMTLLDSLLKFHAHWDQELRDPVWKGMSLIVRRFPTFLNYNRDKAKKALMQRFT